ncbi:hypothetical protein FA95DRAFT_1589605 [Auriscalpium vulgare]|uniref:Uncharacterized protein n=1 Tax=Auriscalpium vulgare TaxID=40419 RepID=A0ACB8RQK9_9AGAM|nr:hypothetical protein FA95DRAFT_1589605 [Auriscalpium vulgare]
MVYVPSILFALLASYRDDNLPARVPYVFPAPGTDPVADALRARRPNNTLLDLDGVLNNNTIPGTMRELIILRSAVISNAAYIWIQHEPVARSEGLTTAQLQTIRFAPPFSGLTPGTTFHGTLAPELVAALNFADFSLSLVHIPDAVYNGLSEFLSDSQMVLATATVGFYALTARFVVGLNIDDKMGVPVPIPQ